MIGIEQVDPKNKKQVARFVIMPFFLYKNTPQWVPPIRVDVAASLNPDKHPYYEHSDADFFIATMDGKDVGRIAVLENRHYNQYHATKRAQFYYFESIDNYETSAALIERALEWAKSRGLNELIGPKGFGALDGYGILVDGFEHRQMMTMMNYNHPYIPVHLEKLGLTKEVDFVSCYLSPETLTLPDRIHKIAERAKQRGTLSVQQFQSKRELTRWAPRIGKAYNGAFIHNWEYVPLTEKEIKFVLDNILVIADPRLIKIISHKDDAVGFLFGFRDISRALQRSRGRLLPFGIADILIELQRTDWIALNGAGILPEFQGHGGNAVLYSEMERTVKDNHFKHADLTQVAETAVNMRADLINLGGKPYKNHRVYNIKI